MEALTGITMINEAYAAANGFINSKDVQSVMDVGLELLKNVNKTEDIDSQYYIHENLAASYGNLSKDLQKMDNTLKFTIAATMKKLNELSDLNWDTVVSCMMNNPSLEPLDDEISRSDKIIKESGGDFKFDGSPDQTIVNEVLAWFTGLIADEDVLKDTKIDIEAMGNIVASSGATVDSFESFFAKNEYHERNVIDIGVLRYPDYENPYYKLYRIQLKAWSDSTRILFHQSDKNGVIGEYNMRKFKPRESVISKVKAETIEKGAQSLEGLFE